jgi:osmotically-inducible protein OsmY
MKVAIDKAVAASAALAGLLALGACGEREAGMDPRAESASQVTGQATEISKQERQDANTAVMGAAGETKDAAKDAAAAVGEKVDDAQIVARLKSEFAADKDISAMAIDVDSKEGMVTLSGTVTNSDAKVRADRIARGMKDVKSVNNQLEVKAG